MHGVVTQIEQVIYKFVPQELNETFELLVLDWYEEFCLRVSHCLPIIEEIFEWSIGDFQYFMEECLQIELCGTDDFPEEMGDWSDNDYEILMNIMEACYDQIDAELKSDVITLLTKKNMTFSNNDKKDVVITSVIEVW